MEQEYKTYLYDYNYDGKHWSVDITAKNQVDADAIIKAMPLARYAGELAMRIYVPKFLSIKWFMNLFINWRNK